MSQDPINFSRQLIKGRIAEIIFEQMLRDAGGFTILAFGYENILPELMHRQQDIHTKQTMKVIRSAPDFAVIDDESHDVHLVEVKYRKTRSRKHVFEIASRMLESWKPSYLFIVTPEGFYMGKVADIVREEGNIGKLANPRISEDLQGKYIALLREYISSASDFPDGEE